MVSRIRRTDMIWLGIVGLALVLRFAHLGMTATYVLSNDDEVYDYLGWSLAMGGAYDSGPTGRHNAAFHTGQAPHQPTAYRTPGLPMLLSVIYRLAGHQVFLARLALVMLNSLAAGLLGWLGWQWMRHPAGWWAGVVWAVWPMSVASYYASDRLLTEALAIPLTIAGMSLVLVGWRRRSVGWWVAAGLVMGAATLTRASAFALVALVILTLLLGAWRRRIGWQAVAGVCLGAACLILPWMTRNAMVVGRFTISNEDGVNLWLGNNRWARGSIDGEFRTADSRQMAYIKETYPGFLDLSEADKARVYRRETLRYLWTEPGRLASLWMRKAAVVFTPFSEDAQGRLRWNFAWVWVLPLAWVGWWAMWGDARQGAAWETWLMGLPMMAMWLVGVVVVAGDRYRTPGEPCMVLLATAGLLAVARRWSWRRAAGWCGEWLGANVLAWAWSEPVVALVRRIF